jgi:hypothetical protein
MQQTVLPIALTRAKSLTIRSTAYQLKQKDLEKSISNALEANGLNDLTELDQAFLTFDFSKTFWFDLGTLLWLITLLHKVKKRGNELCLVFPEPVDSVSRNVWNFLLRWRFFDCLRQNVDLPLNLLKPSQIRYLQAPVGYKYASGKDGFFEDVIFHRARLLEINTLGLEGTGTTEPEKIISAFLAKYTDRVIINALALICGWGHQEAVSFAHQVIGEAVHNASLHARGTFSLISMRLDEKNVVLAIADNGRGIPESLRTLRPQLSSQTDAQLIRLYADPEFLLDSYLIKQSVKPGIGSPGRAGDGLHYLKTSVLGHGGELRIRSGRACVDFSFQSGKPYEAAQDDLCMSPGTMIRVITPRKQQPKKAKDAKKETNP